MLKVMLSLVILYLCSSCSEGDNDTSGGIGSVDRVSSNALEYGGATRPLNFGIADVIGNGNNYGQYEIVYRVSDVAWGFTTILIGGIPQISWFSDNNSVVFSTHIYTPSTAGFEPGTYEYVDNAETRAGNTVGRPVFSFAYIGIDFNGDGNVENDAEHVDVISGTLSVTGGSIEEAVLQFNLTLETGETVTGRFDSGFRIVE